MDAQWRSRCRQIVTVALTVVIYASSTAVSVAQTAERWGYPGGFIQIASSCWPANDNSQCNSSGLQVNYARDNSTVTAWSSGWHNTGAASEWMAFFWPGGPQTTNYVTFVPRVFNGRAMHVPKQVLIEVHKCQGSSCAWQPVTTVDLPRNMTPDGYTVFFTPQQTDGIRLSSNALRDDGAGNYYFQIAELYAGDGSNITNSGPTATLDFTARNIRCDVYGYSRQTVLDDTASQLSYFFNVTQISTSPGPKQYAAVFHSEPFKPNLPQLGDSVSVVYSSSPDSFPRSADGDDYVITRTYPDATPSRFMNSLHGPGPAAMDQNSGGANPILLKSNGTAPDGDYGWGVFYVSVNNIDPVAETPTQTWRHSLHLSAPRRVDNMKAESWYTLARNPSGDYWAWTGTRPKLLATDVLGYNFDPWPVRDFGSQRILSTDYGWFSQNGEQVVTDGMIGNMSYNFDKSQVYFFHYDRLPNGSIVSYRRRMHKPTTTTWWNNWWDSAEATFGNNLGVGMISFYNEVQKWAIFTPCIDLSNPNRVNYAWDVCLAFSPTNGDSVSEFCPPGGSCGTDLGTQSQCLNVAPYVDSLKTTVPQDPSYNPADLLEDGGIMEQFGFLKNPYGQIQVDTNGYSRMYVTERHHAYGGGEWDENVYSFKVRCYVP